MSEYAYIEFNTLDWKNENVLSSYALEQTPLTFIPNLDAYDYVRVLWNYGDGTISTSLSGSKYYTEPGQYKVELTVYNCYSNAVISTEYKIIDIYDYFSPTFTVDFEDPSLYDDISWEVGKIHGPITIKTYHPPNNTQDTLFYRISGSESEYYFDDTPYKFQHLIKNYSFYEKQYNNYTKNYQFVEIDSIKTSPTNIYAKISGTNIINTTSDDPDSFVVGLSGYKEVYFKDDSINKINIDLFFDKQDTIYNGLNTLKISLSANITDNPDIDHLSITSNGMDGEYYSIDSFKIDNKKFSHVDIPFVIKIKDSENFSVKNFPELSATNISISILSSGDLVPSSYYTINDVNSFNGAARGKVLFKNNSKIHNVQLSAYLTTTNDQGSSYSLDGITNYFDVYPNDYISIEKKNEDFDAKEMFKGLRFQEFLLDKDVLFEDFMGSIFGTLSSSYDTLGKKIYEKISNFTENTQDVDRNEIFSLISQMEMMGTDNDVFNSNLFTYPEKIKRLMDLGSISQNKLLGFNNKFRENFDIKGHVSKEIYGTNLGEEINTTTYTITAGVPIVALEKFSNTYTLLNTEQPTESVNKDFKYLQDHLISEVDTLIADKDPLTTKQLYITGGGIGAYVPRDPNCILAGYDTTGWASSFPGTWPAIAITKRHVTFPYHWVPAGTNPPIGAQFWFYDQDGNRVIGTAADRLRVGTTDIMVVLLANDLPDSIKPVRIASTDFFDRLDWTNTSLSNPKTRTPMVCHKQLYGKIGITDFISTPTYLTFNKYWYGSSPIDPTRASFFSGAIPGDSGNPLSFLYKGDVVLVGFYTSPLNGPRFASSIDEINSTIKSINETNGVSGTYEVNVITPIDDTKNYPLSDYNTNWGWPLVLPDSFQFSDIEKYYTFFEYEAGYENTLMDYSIKYDPTLYSTLSGENVLLNELGDEILDENSEPIMSEFEFNYTNELLNLAMRDTLYKSLSLVRDT